MTLHLARPFFNVFFSADDLGVENCTETSKWSHMTEVSGLTGPLPLPIPETKTDMEPQNAEGPRYY